MCNVPSLSLRLLATTDLHGHVAPHDYLSDQAAPDRGLAHAAALMDKAAADAPNVLRFDIGDTLQGTPLSDITAVEACRAGKPNPVVAAMATVGYDAVTLGNHDFNFGLPHLIGSLADAPFPVVLTNLRQDDGRPLFVERLLLPRMLRDESGKAHPVMIGVIGLTPTQTVKWDRAMLEGKVTAEDIVDAAIRATSSLRKEGADVVVALAHTGLGEEDHVRGMENAIRPLARLAGLDAIFAGHTHQRVPAPGRGADFDPDRGLFHGTPVAQAGSHGRRIAVIDLTLRRQGQDWHVAEARAGTEPRDGLPEPSAAEPVLRSVERAHRDTRQRIHVTIGRTARPLHSHFALAGPSALVQLLGDAQIASMRALQAAGGLPDLPILCAAAPFRAGGRGGVDNYTDIPAGPLTLRNMLDLAGFPNALSVLEVTGAQLTDWLDRSAAAFRQIDGSGGPLIEDGFAAYNFDTMIGARYVIDLTRPASYSYDGHVRLDPGSRIRDLSVEGRPLGPEDRVLVVTSTYRANGGGSFDAPLAATMRHCDPQLVRSAVSDYVRARGTVDPAPEPTWRFHAPTAATAMLTTGPGAAAQIDEAARLGLTLEGEEADGRLRFRIDFDKARDPS